MESLLQLWFVHQEQEAAVLHSSSITIADRANILLQNSFSFVCRVLANVGNGLVEFEIPSCFIGGDGDVGGDINVLRLLKVRYSVIDIFVNISGPEYLKRDGCGEVGAGLQASIIVESSVGKERFRFVDFKSRKSG